MSKKLFSEFIPLNQSSPLKEFELAPQSPKQFQGFLSFRAQAPKSGPTFGFKDHVQLIEGAINFSQLYSTEKSPEQDIRENKIASTIFKVSEDTIRKTITYHFWKRTRTEPAYYIIIVSTKDKQIDDIEYKEEGSIPVKFFKITDDNQVNIVPYQTARL